MSGHYAQPTHECDIVMKGGITSGVVYPGAVDKLARRYAFRSIGGTSAGAIAAAIVAAAEYARNDGRPEAFEEVAKLPKQLGATRGGKSLLLRLFQADAETGPLFAVVLGFIAGGPVGAFGKAVARFPRFPLIGLVTVVACVALAFAGAHLVLVVAGVAVGLAVAAGGLLSDVVHALFRLSDHDFGLCRLGPRSPDDPGDPDEPALTVWLHERIQTISGRAGHGVLTFADLWGAPPDEDDPRVRHNAQQCFSRFPHLRKVDLQMVTTDLTHGRPWRLPVPYRPYGKKLEDDGGLLFKPEELKKFFPKDVVEHLVRCGGDPEDDQAAALGEDLPLYKCFPIGPDLPVVVATRMSLSFPVLIAAIPLYKVQFLPGGKTAVRRVTFSDGGISSNFPVHLFDAALPTRPTFALHLTGFEPGDGPIRDDPCHSVDGPTAPNQPAIEPMAQFTSLFGFATAIKDAMQNWRDNTASRLPGSRERVVHIRLDKHEGGLNLTMNEDKVTELSERGACAGHALADAFAGPQGFADETEHWNDHRFVRFRVAMSLMERQLADLAHGYTHDFGPGATDYGGLAAQHETASPYPYGSKARTTFADTRAKEYVRLSKEPETLDDPVVPRPSSTMRRVPPV
jgi:predicted acylesterase/phospholipase RssA